MSDFDQTEENKENSSDSAPAEDAGSETSEEVVSTDAGLDSLETVLPKSRIPTYTAIVASFLVLGGTAAFLFLRGGVSSEPMPLIPTLDLTIAEQKSEGGFFARLIGTNVDGDEIHYFEEAESSAGFIALTGDNPERHNIFDTDQSGLEANVAFGYPEKSEASVANGGLRYWVYEYTGNEETLRDAGETGRALFAGRFWLSAAEQEVSPQYTWLHENINIVAGSRYYVMTSEDICVSTLDSDGDRYNDGCELEFGTDVNDADTDDDGILDGDERITHGTDPLNSDTDSDGLQDGTEVGLDTAHADTDDTVFIPDADTSTTTDPLLADTDGGGLDDGAEDVNQDGAVDVGEKDPNDPSDDIDGPTEDCSTSADEDGDSVAGCYDDDCLYDIDNCDQFDTTVESYCTNSIDDDFDGDTDCDDTDCDSDPACAVVAEVCDNNLDDDEDGFIDCDDSDCDSDPACIVAEVCGDMLVTGGEQCDDGKHCDDGTGAMVECSDADTSMCSGACELQDGDGCSSNCLQEDAYSCTDEDPDLPNVRSVCEFIEPELVDSTP